MSRGPGKVWMKLKDYNSIKSFIEYAELSVYPLIVMNMCQRAERCSYCSPPTLADWVGVSTNRICWINLAVPNWLVICSRLSRTKSTLHEPELEHIHVLSGPEHTFCPDREIPCNTYECVLFMATRIEWSGKRSRSWVRILWHLFAWTSFRK